MNAALIIFAGLVLVDAVMLAVLLVVAIRNRKDAP